MRHRHLRVSLALLICGCMLLGGLGIATVPAAAEDFSAEDTADPAEWEKVSGLVGQYYGEWRNTNYAGLFSERIPQTALLGNGDVGVSSGGDATKKTFHISKSDFWTFGGSPLPIGGVTIAPTVKSGGDMPVSLAQGMPVTASSNHEAFPPGRITNGQWTDEYEGWVSNVGNPQWAVIDLGEAIAFDRIIIRH
ncbi:MAG: discoidin domain-containing protein, partial [Oscillospiraceae bacterium]|nr:discoidin domain-containing protein [Oscillospiraceae bacterium]